MASITFTNNDISQIIREIQTFLQQIGATNVIVQPVPPCPVPLPVVPTAAPQTARPSTAAPTTVPDYTHEQLGRSLAAWIDKSPDNRNKALALLQQQGVQGVTQLDTPAKRGAFAVALRAQGVQV